MEFIKPIKPQTNEDRIRAMRSFEADAQFAISGCPSGIYECPEHYCCAWCWLDWLKQPAEDSDG